MSQKNETALTDQEESDVFDQMAETFDKEIGANGRANSFRDVIEDDDQEDVDLPASESVDANAQQQAQAEDEFNFESLSPSAQKKFQELEHSAKSQAGRVSALQRQADEFKSQLESLQQKGKGDSKAAQELEDKIEKTEINLGGLQDELPELNSLVEAINRIDKKVNGVQSKVNGVETRLQDEVISPNETRAAKEALAREEQALNDTHKDKSVIESSPAFWNWVDSQHSSVSSLANSNKAEDVSYLLSLYKKSNPSPTTPSANKPPRNLDDMTVLPSSGNSRSISATGDEDELFNHFADLADKGKL